MTPSRCRAGEKLLTSFLCFRVYTGLLLELRRGGKGGGKQKIIKTVFVNARPFTSGPTKPKTPAAHQINIYPNNPRIAKVPTIRM